MQANILPFPMQTSDCYLTTATVKNVSPEAILIETVDGIMTCETAFSCLVKPAAEDFVLVSNTQGKHFILSILERKESNDMSLQFPGNTSLNTNGTLQIGASQTAITSARIQFTADKITANAHSADIHVKHQNIFAESITTVANQINERTHNFLRWVEGVETLNIGTLIQKIRKTFISNSEQAVITAQSDMRIDAERIHMG